MSLQIPLSDLNFSKIEVKIDVTEIYRMIDKFVEESKGKECTWVLNEILRFLRLPVEEEVEAFAKRLGREFVFAGLFETIVVDEENNPIIRIPPEEKTEFDKMFQYRLYLKFHSLLSRDIFNKLKESGFPIFKCILDKLGSNPFLVKHMPFIETGISEQVNGHFMASILILGLRIEGILRSILKRHNINTLRKKEDGTVEEKTLGGIFWIPQLREIIGNDLYQYLHVLLIKKEGENIRNGLAHSLIDYNEFNEELSSLLILALLFLDQRIETMT